MVNIAGNNGTNNGERKWHTDATRVEYFLTFDPGPADDILKEALMRYARLRLSINAKIANLATEYNYHIKCVFKVSPLPPVLEFY